MMGEGVQDPLYYLGNFSVHLKLFENSAFIGTKPKPNKTLPVFRNLP